MFPVLPLRALITAFGSHGDVLPFIALGQALQQRGVDVVLQTNPFFGAAVAQAGLALLPAGTVDDYHRFFSQPVEGDPRRAMAQVAAELMDVLPATLADARRLVWPGRTVAIGGSLGFVHRLLADVDGLPCATVHLAPSVFRSSVDPPLLVPGMAAWRRMATPALNRLMWWLMDRGWNDRHFTHPVNAVRRQLGLAPIDRALGDWLHRVDVLLALFPAWFAPPPPDWPSRLQLAGFALQDGAAGAALPPAVAAFLDQGPPPVVFAPGTANGMAQDFFQQSVQACAQAGLRGLFVTHFARQLPTPLPPGLMQADYVPFGALLPRVAALVHHGGIGTVQQALRAGVPQLLRPVAYDQFDNADRVQRLGVGRVLLPGQYTAPVVAQTLQQLLADPALRLCGQALARRLVHAGDAVQVAADAVLAGCGPRLAVQPRDSASSPARRVM